MNTFTLDVGLDNISLSYLLKIECVSLSLSCVVLFVSYDVFHLIVVLFYSTQLRVCEMDTYQLLCSKNFRCRFLFPIFILYLHFTCSDSFMVFQSTHVYFIYSICKV